MQPNHDTNTNTRIISINLLSACCMCFGCWANKVCRCAVVSRRPCASGRIGIVSALPPLHLAHRCSLVLLCLPMPATHHSLLILLSTLALSQRRCRTQKRVAGLGKIKKVQSAAAHSKIMDYYLLVKMQSKLSKEDIFVEFNLLNTFLITKYQFTNTFENMRDILCK